MNRAEFIEKLSTAEPGTPTYEFMCDCLLKAVEYCKQFYGIRHDDWMPKAELVSDLLREEDKFDLCTLFVTNLKNK